MSSSPRPNPTHGAPGPATSPARRRGGRGRRILSWCVDTTLWARVSLSLFVVWYLCVFIPVLVVDYGGICMAGFLVTMLFTQCSLWSSTGPRCSASWPLWKRRTSMRSSSFVSGSGVCVVGFAGFASRAVSRRTSVQFVGSTGDDALRAVLPFLMVRPRCSAQWPVWIRRTVASRSTEKLDFTERCLCYVSVLSTMLGLHCSHALPVCVPELSHLFSACCLF